MIIQLIIDKKKNYKKSFYCGIVRIAKFERKKIFNHIVGLKGLHKSDG